MSMMCRFAERWISVKVDGETLPDDVAARLDAHLRVCPACTRNLEGELRRAEMLSRALVGDASSERALADSILDAAGTAQMGGVGSGRIRPGDPWWSLVGARRFALAAAAILVVGMVGLWLLPRKPPPPPAGPWKLSLETVQWDLDPMRGVDGVRWGKTTRRTQEVLLDPGGEGPESQGSDVLLHRDRVDTENIKFTGYPYH